MDDKEFRDAYAELVKTDRKALADLIVEYIDPESLGLC